MTNNEEIRVTFFFIDSSMPKLTDIQINTIKLLDYLYFYDIVSLETFSDEKSDFYKRLNDSFHLILATRKYKGLRAEHYKHLLLMGLDLNIAYYSKSDKMQENDVSNFISAFNDEIRLEVDKADFPIDEFAQDLQNILDRQPINPLSGNERYKIVSQFLSYEYDNIAIGVLGKLLDMGILKVSKYSKAYQVISQELLDKLFFRAMLFLELEIFKNKLLASNLKMSQIVDLNNLSDHEKVIAVIKSNAKLEALEKVDYQRIYTIDLNKKNDLSRYFTNVEARLGHNPIFKPNLASWVSLLGAWHLMLVKKNNINKPLYRETPIHILDAEPTCSEIAKKEMEEYGFAISERTLFDQHNSIFDFYKLIRITANDMIDEGFYGVLEPVLTKYFFYDPNIGDKFKSALSKVNMSLNQ